MRINAILFETVHLVQLQPRTSTPRHHTVVYDPLSLSPSVSFSVLCLSVSLYISDFISLSLIGQLQYFVLSQSSRQFFETKDSHFLHFACKEMEAQRDELAQYRS